MKFVKISVLTLAVLTVFSCSDDDPGSNPPTTSEPPNFSHVTTIDVGGEASAEIVAFDPGTNKLFIVNNDDDAGLHEITVYDISDINSPVQETSIDVSGAGAPNSIAVYGDMLAVAVEAPVKQDPGVVLVFDTSSQGQTDSYDVGALPDMLTFSPDGNYILVANEGEPNEDYNIDPEGSVSIIEVATGDINTLTFEAFNAQEATLEDSGFRVFGPGTDLASDVEPEFIAVSDDSQTAWVALQENNGIARINLNTQIIEAIYPLGFKDYSIAGNEIDASDEDDVKELKSWPVFGMYQPDALAYVSINGTEYIISANEGDARDYDGFSEEERIADLILDPTVFPVSEDYQNNANLGRLEITTTLGDTDGDGDYDALYSYGARSFSIWSADGQLVYDSGNEIAARTLDLNPGRFNDDDGRSDAKGAEPEAVEVLQIDDRYILFVGMERTDGVLVYDITTPTAPVFLQWLLQAGDEAPEGLVAVPDTESPSGKALLIVANEDSGTVSIFEN